MKSDVITFRYNLVYETGRNRANELALFYSFTIEIYIKSPAFPLTCYSKSLT